MTLTEVRQNDTHGVASQTQPTVSESRGGGDSPGLYCSTSFSNSDRSGLTSFRTMTDYVAILRLSMLKSGVDVLFQA